jgi:hypothetical protein
MWMWKTATRRGCRTAEGLQHSHCVQLLDAHRSAGPRIGDMSPLRGGDGGGD